MRKSYWNVSAVLAMFLCLFAAEHVCAAPANGNRTNEPRETNGTGGNASTAGASNAQDEKSLIAAAQAMRRAGIVQFNFTDIELIKFIRFMSELLQVNIIVPSTVTGKITVISPTPSTIPEARQIMLSILQTNGWSIQNMGSYYKLVQGGVSPSPSVTRGKGGPGSGEETVTQIVPLDYIVADQVVQALQQAFGQTVIVLPVGNGRDIMLQGRAVDVNKGVEFIRKLDIPDVVKTGQTFRLKYGDATAIANQLNAIAQTGGYLRGLTAIPDQISHQILVVAELSVMADAARIIKDLDVERTPDDGFHIYKLQNVDAVAAAEQISKVLATSAMLQPNQDGKYPATVVPDLTTNSLIFACNQRQYDSLERILKEIDIQPRQVLIRGFIAEVNVTNLNKAGIDWSILGGQIWDNFMLGGQGQLGEAGVPSQFLEWFNELSREEKIEKDDFGNSYTTTNYRPLALVYATFDMLKKYDAINVLSMPRLMCTDNKESSFQVGQVIPVLKGSASDLSNPNAIQQNFDYKDTGLTLTVTPHIRSGNVVALDIKQTTEDVLSAMGSVTPVTAKRQLETSVTVGNGETIVLGGIVKETEKSLKRRVPGLSYIPLIGSLFQKTSKEKEKVDFIIFLTPTIINNIDEMRTVTSSLVMISPDFGVQTQNLSPAEIETDRRFRELYRQSVRAQ